MFLYVTDLVSAKEKKPNPRLKKYPNPNSDDYQNWTSYAYEQKNDGLVVPNT